MAGMEQIGLDAALGQAGFGAGETVISGYFAGQMAGMLMTGFRARKMGRDQSDQSITFQQELSEIRQGFSREKSQAELDFLRECHEKGMAYQREVACLSYRNRQQEEEFRKFCESSWQAHFRPDIGAVLAEMEHPEEDENGHARMKVMVARTPMVAMGNDRKGAYCGFCDFFKDEFLRENGLGVDTVWLRAWERDCVSAMADTMNLHYIMQGLPSIVLCPIQRGDLLSLETATWAYQLGQTGMSFNKTFRIPMQEVEAHVDRLNNLMLAAIAYIDDCYRVLLCRALPESLYKVKDALMRDEYVWNLLCEKYQSLIATVTDTMGVLSIDNDDLSQLINTVRP